MDPFARRLQAAQGYLELGLPLEASEEIEAIDPDMCKAVQVLIMRIAIFQALGNWQEMGVASHQLCEQRPDDPQWAISLAYATRRADSLERALSVLTHALLRFNDEPIIHFNLACYEAQLGHLDLARRHLQEAIKRAPACRKMALEDDDLAPLHEELRR